MCLNIRSLTKSDTAILAQMTDQFDHNTWTQRVFDDCLKAHYLGWVLENTSGETLGFMIALIDQYECQLMNIGIDPSYQRQGYARYLLEALIKHLKSIQVKHLSLEVRQSNTTAIALYKKMGFQEVGLRKGYYPLGCQREDGLILFLNL